MIQQWNAGSPTEQVGTIDSVEDSTDEITVTLDSTLSFSSNDFWVIRFDVASQIGTTADPVESDFGYWADDTRRIQFSTAETAGRFSP